ncbi:MAG TPA: homoserine O-acetyltransferase [Rhodothermales bacterium]|nr:homoserine O-acetyltransferase [Rhodothermales bacterium]
MRHVHILPAFRLESGAALREVPVAYHTWGRLAASGDNVVVVCHPLTADSDAARWWGALIGPGRPFDTRRHFVVCLNVPGSPYGTVSPLTTDPDTGRPYGPRFPAFTIRDTVALHRAVLDALGVRRVPLAVGGSMGGMHVLEWAFQGDFVRAIAPIAVGGRHSAWGVAWTEAQRQALFADPRWDEGRYAPDAPPAAGLAAARQVAMLGYRTPGSFSDRFGRTRDADRFAVEAYLHHQGESFVRRFDANCYVALSRQLNTHDVARGRGAFPDVLGRVRQPALVVGIASDGLYPLDEQREVAAHLPNARLAVLPSPHGHDAFLLDFDLLEAALRPWLARHLVPSPRSLAAAQATP